MLSLKLDMSEVYEQMDFLEKRAFPAALASSMTKCMWHISQRFLRREIDNYIAGGAVKWSKGGILYKRAHVKNLYAAVYYKEDRYYLATVTFGGTVIPHEGNKFLIEPGSLQRLNKYGNIPRNTLKRKKAQKHLYFVGRPGKNPQKAFGLYRRYKKQAPKLVINLNRKEREQKAIFPAPEISAREFYRIFDGIFNEKLIKKMSKMEMPTGF